MSDYPYEAIVFLGDKDEIVEYTGDEVVRCNECIHNVGIRDNTEFYDNDIVCDYWESDGLYSTDFCSYGERAEA